MHIQLPSNKIGGLFIAIVLIVVLVISGDVFLGKFQSSKGPEIVDGNLYIERKTTNDSSIDQDQDGLLDWQELMYKSNSQIADTDADGTKDGDEIKEGRDPVIAGPDDKLIKFKDLLETNFSVDYKPESVTGNLSIELLANYLNLKKTNVYNPETTQSLTDDLANKASVSVGLVNVFEVSKLRTVETNKETLTKYGTEFAKIQINYTNQMRLISDSDDYKYVAEIASDYKKLAEALSLIDVPQNSASVHANIINMLYNNGVLIAELNDYNSDPVKGLFAIKKIKENSKGEDTFYQSLANYFKDNGIIFTDNDVIAFWNLYK